ncbi:MAG: MarR family winged helix-turn-helix transcriptional regulator [Pseudomonadales bacterium]
MSTSASLTTLNSAMTQLMRAIRRVDEAQGIGRARLSALAVLHFGGRCTSSELAAQEMVSRATMHHILKGLEADGLVQRRPDRDDGRRQLVCLTRQGRAAIRKAHRARISWLEQLAAGMDAADLEKAALALDTLRNRSFGPVAPGLVRR